MPAQGYFGVRTPPGGGGVGPDLNNISFVFKNLNNLSPMSVWFNNDFELRLF